ncbi:MAG TPA: hypothetical protein VGN52_20365 [Burkholderiales bacterium]|jgi:hypothetical protein
MEILAWLAAAVTVNAVCMAQITRWQAHRLRGWRIYVGEALRLHGLASLEGAFCALATLYGLAWVRLNSNVELALTALAFFIPYYFQLRVSTYRLAKSQRERGRGIARANVRDIANGTFGYALGLYVVSAGIAEMIWKMGNR